MITDLLNHTVTIQEQEVTGDALHGQVIAYQDLYANVPARFQDLSQKQIEALQQLMIDADHQVFLQLPGSIEDSRSAVVFDGGFYRVVGRQKRRAIGGMTDFDVLLLKRAVP